MSQVSFNRVEATVGFALEVAVIASGALVYLWDLALAVHLAGLLAFGADAAAVDGARHSKTRGVIFILIVSLVSAVVKLPFQVFSVIGSRQADGARSGLRALCAWAVAQGMVFVLSVGAGVPIIYTLLWILEYHGSGYWLLNWFFLALLSVTISDLYSTVVAPFFDTYESLPPGSLRTELELLTERSHCPVSEIYIRKSKDEVGGTHSNAFFMGVGTSRSIVLYDTLLKRMSEQDVLAIIAHEIAHVKANHFWKQVVLEFATIGVFFGSFAALVENTGYYQAFGFSTTNPAIGLVLFSYMYTPIASMLQTLQHVATRSFEFAADRYAAKLGYDLELPLIKLHLVNMVNIHADKLFSLYHYSHPSLCERLDALATIKAKMS
ncbi:Afc1 protein [Thecamonas trahens ATCC 50062]|uniref:CAAX prenyl protease n=1 Tax=Thecamonas trahens ATCC 50062 TaxID=461836 RepID=A0A0L0D245_THETB|nr:Afc1 protein [Thecamonas trahens ATCC 50062]KNC46352.1 Afc1 protein [Thecamonas trahens ATCC 50062]|eukprot:XP_013760645.1 Afc1 protein [Thecamonas trahens ATCC 50062]